MEIFFTSSNWPRYVSNSLKETDINEHGEDLMSCTNKLISEIVEGTGKQKFLFKRDTIEVRRVISEFLNGSYDGNHC